MIGFDQIPSKCSRSRWLKVPKIYLLEEINIAWEAMQHPNGNNFVSGNDNDNNDSVFVIIKSLATTSPMEMTTQCEPIAMIRLAILGCSRL